MIEFKSISEQTVKDTIAHMVLCSNNPRFVATEFSQYFDEQVEGQIKIWYGIFINNECKALAVLKKLPYMPDVILLAEIQSIEKGYGKPLIENILLRSQNIWWCAEPAGGEDLLNYYRQFNCKEYLIKMSKWTNTPEYAFYKANDIYHEQMILNNLKKADLTLNPVETIINVRN